MAQMASMSTTTVTAAKLCLVLLAGPALSLGCSRTEKRGPSGKVEGREVSYSGGGITMKGYLSTDPSVPGPKPGILVVHEWWGHNSYARTRADMLAGLGYTALAVDMYGDGRKAEHPKDAMRMAGAVMKDFASAQARFRAALAVLKKDPSVDGTRMAAIGYCFGGGVVLNMARQGEDLRAVISFHGSLSAGRPARKGAVTAKLLVLNGADDGFTKAGVGPFKKEMAEAGADLTFIDYPGAVHAFTNPEATALGTKFNLPLAYNEAADKKSWADMQSFLTKVLAR